MKILGILAVVLVGFGLGLFAYMGGFYSVEISKGSWGPSEFIYTTHKGPYEKLNESWMAFDKATTEAGLKECESLSVYLDPPGTPPEDLRSILACDLNGVDAGTVKTLKGKFSSIALPQSNALLARFPFKNMFSFMFGPKRVYPKMQEVIRAENISPLLAIENYGVIGKFNEIRYAMPYDVDKKFYQPLYDAF